MDSACSIWVSIDYCERQAEARFASLGDLQGKEEPSQNDRVVVIGWMNLQKPK